MKGKTNYLISFFLALVVFLLSKVFLLVVLLYLNLPLDDLRNFSKWDSGHYLEIATKGYDLFPCLDISNEQWLQDKMCGNAGWFYGYPYFIRLGAYLFSSSNYLLVAVILSNIFYFLTLFLVSFIKECKGFTTPNILYLTLAAFSFGGIYYHAAFPISMLLFAVLWSFYAFKYNQKLSLFVSIFFATSAYSTGFLLSLVVGMAYFITQKGTVSKKLKSILLPASAGLVGLLSSFAIYHCQVGAWDAFYQVQAKYGHGLHNPIKNIGIALLKIKEPIFELINVPILQSVLVLTGSILLIMRFFHLKLYKNKIAVLSMLFVGLMILFPWSIGGDISIYRAESILLPFVLLLNPKDTKRNSFILSVFVIIYFLMSILFFQGVLV